MRPGVLKGAGMAFDKILVPVDGSDGSNRALEVAAELAALNPQAHFDVVHVVPIPNLNEEETHEFRKILDMMLDDGKQVLAEAVERMGSAADQADALIMSSVNPAGEIVKLAEERSYDLIVIGNRGLSGRKEYAGSVSYKVLHAAGTSVLIAK